MIIIGVDFHPEFQSSISGRNTEGIRSLLQA